MKITNGVVENYLNCRHKALLALKGESGSPHDYEVLMNELAEEYRPKATEALLRRCNLDSAPRISCVTLDDLKQRHALILDCTIETDQFQFHFDALKRTDEEPSLKSFHYQPVMFRHEENVREAAKMLLVYGAFILGQDQEHMPELGTLVVGQASRITTIQLGKRSQKLVKPLDELRHIRDGTVVPNVRLNRHCDVCEFRQRCGVEATKKDDLSILRGMSDAQIEKYNSRGIFTVYQLSYTFRPRRRRAASPPPRGNAFALKALALREKRTYIQELPDLPIPTTQIYLDLEGLPDENFDYLVGLLIVQDDGTENASSLWADSEREEEQIFQRLFDLISAYSQFTIYHYGSYELRSLDRVNRKSKGRYQGQINSIVQNSVNVLSFFSQTVYTPTYTNSLKEIAGYLGFRWSERNVSGIDSLIWRKRWELSHDIDLRNKLLQYNGDDCRALRCVTEWLRKVGASVWQDADDVPINVQDIEPKGVFPFRFTNFKSEIEEFEHINKCAYFDYQRSRVYLKTSKDIKKALNRTQRQEKRRDRPNKVCNVPPVERCPSCGHDKLYKHDKESHKTIDLKVSKSGIKKWVVLVRGSRFRCCRCEKTTRSDGLKGVPKYGRELTAWAFSQHITSRIPLNTVVRILSESFKIHIPVSTIGMLRSDFAGEYGSTYEEIERIVTSGCLIHIDETTAKVKGFPSAHVWVLASMDTVLYLFRPNRETDFLRDMLRTFDGVLISDFYQGYYSLPCAQQKCLVHLMRDLNADLLQNQFDAEYRNIVVGFARLLRQIVGTVERYGLKKRNLKKHKRDVDKFFGGMCDKEFESELAGRYRKRFLKNKDCLFTFLDHDNVPWNNNNAEHAIIPFAKYRTIRTIDFTEKALREYLILLSIQQTCVYRGVSFWEFLRSKAMSIEEFTIGN